MSPILAALRLCFAPALAFMVMGAGWSTVAAYIPEIKAALGVPDAVFGALLLCSSLGLVTAMWLAPRLDAALGPWAVPAAAAAMACAFVLPGVLHVPLAFGLGMVVLGGTSGLCDVVMNSRVSELEERHGRPLMSLAHAMFSFVYAAGALLCAPARAAGMPAWAMLGLVALAGLALTPRMRGGEGLAAETAEGGGAPWRIVGWGGAIVLTGFLIENAMEGWSALHIERSLGGAAAQGALGPAVLGLTMGIGRLLGHVLSGRLAEGRVLTGAALLAGAGLWIAAAAPGPALAYLGFAAAGFGVSVIAPTALSLVGRSVPARLRTVAIARASVMGYAGFFIGPSLMGGLSGAFGLPTAFAVVGTAVLLVPLASFMLRGGRAVVRAAE